MCEQNVKKKFSVNLYKFDFFHGFFLVNSERQHIEDIKYILAQRFWITNDRRRNSSNQNNCYLTHIFGMNIFADR